MISLEQIRYFLVIVQCGSLNKAAERLYLSQPSLTKQLHHLEQSLGCELLKRNYGGIEPTPQGRFFYERMNGLLNDFDHAIDQVMHFGEIRHLRIGGLANLVTYFLPPYMERLRADGKYRITVDTRFSNEELVDGVGKGIFDLALLSNAEQQPGVAVVPLMTEPLYVVFPVGHRLSSLKEISFLSLMLHEKLVLYKDPCTIRASIRKQCNQMKVTPDIVVELDLTESLLTYVSRGDGVTLLPAIVASSIRSPQIGVREINRVPIYREISVAMKKEDIPNYLPLFTEESLS